jgi:hypothetical protein
VLPNAKLQLRNIDTGSSWRPARRGAAYEFTGSFRAIMLGIADDSDRVIRLSAAPRRPVAGCRPGGGDGVRPVGGAFFASTAGILLLVGIGAGVTAGVIAATNDASPSR